MVLLELWPAHHLSWPRLWVGVGIAPALLTAQGWPVLGSPCPPRNPAVAGTWVSMARASKDTLEVFCVWFFWGVE